MNNDIEEALHECQAYAQKGYDIASNTWNTIHQALLAEERKVKKVDKQQGKISRLADEELIKKKKGFWRVEEIRSIPLFRLLPCFIDIDIFSYYLYALRLKWLRTCWVE